MSILGRIAELATVLWLVEGLEISRLRSHKIRVPKAFIDKHPYQKWDQIVSIFYFEMIAREILILIQYRNHKAQCSNE